ncbi:hypothetical protein WG906_00850 [Pedobacter sp. P351]|uniref:hypothetical protein n=1 Tax=Pedobacter superstes TaxID=3133441 RepID=UPI003098BE55
METYFSIIFKTIRRNLGCTTTEFAQFLEIEESEVLQIENDGSVPSLRALCKLDTLGLN